MALATRNLYLVLKARDEASRVIRGFGRELSQTGKLAQAESLRNSAAVAEQRASYLAMTGAAQADIDKQKLLAKQMRNQAAELERSHRSAVRLSNALHTVSATLITVGSGLAIGGAIGLAFLYEASKASTEYARTVAYTATQVDGFKVSLQQISDVGLQVAKNIAVPFEEIQPALYNIFSSTNANLAQATTLLKAFSKAAVAGQVPIDDAAKGTIAIMNAFNIPLEQVNRVLDIQFQLVRKGVGTYADFAAVFGRVVPSANRANQSFEEVGAMLAYLTRNGLSAAMASSSAARALDAMSNPKAVSNMEKLGIKVRDAAGNMLPLETELQNLRKYLLSLPNADRVAALVNVFKGAGGTIQARRFLDQVLLKPGELEEYMGFLNDMKNSNGQFENAYVSMSNTVAAQTQLMKNQWKVMEVTIGQAVTPILVTLLKWLNKLMGLFNNLSPQTQKYIAIGIALTSVFSVLAGVTLIVIGALAGIAAAIIAAGSGFFMLVGGVLGLITAMATLTGAFIYAVEKSKHFREILQEIHDTASKLWHNILVPFAEDVKRRFDAHLLPALRRLRDVIENDVLPAWEKLQKKWDKDIVPVLMHVSIILKTYLGKVLDDIAWAINTKLIPAIIWLGKYYKAHEQTINEVVMVLAALTGALLVVSFIIGTVLAGVLVGPIIAIILGFAAALAGITMAIIWMIEWVKGLIRWFSDFGAHMDWVGQHVKDAWNSVVQWFKNLGSNIMQAIGDTKTLLLDAGKNIIQGLIDGVKSKIPSLGDVVAGAAKMIKDHFPFSPAKRGPLSGRGNLFYAGQKMMQQLSDGIESEKQTVAVSTSGVALNAAGSQLASPATKTGTVTQNFTIHTQEINPRKHSQELGFLLASRV